MIKVFYGENRVMAGEGVKKFLGEKYEVIEGAEMAAEDLVNVFLGASLFDDERKILIRDLLANKGVAEMVGEYVETPHKIALLETKVDKRSNVYKALKDKVEFIECKMPRDVDAGAVFDIYKVAKRDGMKAVEMLRKIEPTQDPIMFEGLVVSQVMKECANGIGAKEKRVLRGLAELDMKLKSSGMDAWVLVEAWLMGVRGA